MKATKFLKRLLAAGMFLLLLVTLAACQKEQPETMLQPPVEGLTWGMTQEEVLAALHLEEDGEAYANGTGSTLNLNYALAGLGAELEGMQLTAENQAVQLHFNTYQGVRRLSTVALYVHAENGPALREALTAAYGEPYEGEMTLWSGTDLQKDAADTDTEKLDEYDLAAALRVAGGEQKLFALRPYVTVYTNTALPALKLNQSYDFLLIYRADSYLKSLYGSQPRSGASLAEPIEGLRMGMSRAEFAAFIGTTEEELLAKNKREIMLEHTALGMEEPAFLGFELCGCEDGTLRELRVAFTESGEVAIMQAIVLADSVEDLETRLTRMYGEPVEDYMIKWYDPNAEGKFLTYVDNQAVIDGQRVFTLFVNGGV